MSAWWLAVPILTWGTFAWAPFLYVALRARARGWLAASVVYLAGTVAFLPAAFVHPDHVRAGQAGFVAHWAVAIVATAHLCAAGPWFSRRLSVFDHPDRERAERQVLAREEARRLIAGDANRAKQLGIGRPDLGTAFDGGLVDINHVPPAVIAQLPDMTADVARRIAAIRDDIGGFESLEDFDQVVDLPWRTLEAWRPIAVFLP